MIAKRLPKCSAFRHVIIKQNFYFVSLKISVKPTLAHNICSLSFMFSFSDFQLSDSHHYYININLSFSIHCHSQIQQALSFCECLISQIKITAILKNTGTSAFKSDITITTISTCKMIFTELFNLGLYNYPVKFAQFNIL